jgi:hypothetical protein
MHVHVDISTTRGSTTNTEGLGRRAQLLQQVRAGLEATAQGDLQG